MKKFMMMLAVAAMVVAFAGCKEKTPAEKLGDTVEQAAEKVDEAAKDAQKDAANAVENLNK